MIFLKRLSVGVLLSVTAATAIASSAGAQLPRPSPSSRYWAAVEEALGRKGTLNPGGVLKFSFPRNDLRVIADGVIVKPALALGSWVAFKRIGDHVMVMGDLVVLDGEVASVMASLQQNGVEQTALHNHLLHETPRVMYMHISAMGDAVKIATAIHDALALSKTRFTAPAAGDADRCR